MEEGCAAPNLMEGIVLLSRTFATRMIWRFLVVAVVEVRNRCRTKPTHPPKCSRSLS